MPQSSEELAYRIELWEPAPGQSVERTLARALSVQLARAIFKAAQEENPGRRITLRKGNRVLADTVEITQPPAPKPDIAS
jgi:hypothetical protein